MQRMEEGVACTEWEWDDGWTDVGAMGYVRGIIRASVRQRPLN